MHKKFFLLISLCFLPALTGSAWADYFLGDDFESYSDTPNLKNTWDPTGATGTWYSLELTFVHWGSRSLEIWYENSTLPPYYCGVSRTMDSPKDWTLLGTAEGLSLWFRGSPNADQIYIRLKDSSDREALVKYTDFWDPANLVLEQWQQWKIDFGYFTDNNGVFDMTEVEMLEIGVGEPVGATPGAPGGGQIFLDDIKLYQRKCDFGSGQSEADTNLDCLIDWADVNSMADEWLDDGYDLEADTNRDGKVDFGDHAVLADSWKAAGSVASECDFYGILHPEWIFCDDFEIEQNLSINYQDRQSNGMSVTTNDPFSGSYSLEQHYDVNQVSAGWVTRYIGDNPHLASPGDKIDEIYYRFYHKFEDGFTGLPPKMARIKIFRTSTDWSGGLGIYQWIGGNGPLVADKRTYDGSVYVWLPVTSSTLDYSESENIGRWICIEVRVKLNTTGQSNGEIQYWADGEEILYETGLDLKAEYSNGKGLNMIMWDCYWNIDEEQGIYGSPAEQSRFYDNLVISTAPIGPVSW